MKTIGITGGVGSGKTAILEHFEKHYGAKLLVADEIAHLLEAPGEACYNRLVEAFGNAILNPETKQIDKKAFAGVLFGDKEALDTVNEIIHPEVKKYILQTIEAEKEKGTAYVVVEAALLIECGYVNLLDEIWYIFTKEEIRRQRLKDSRGYSDEKIDHIFRSQLSEREFRKHCIHVIDNNGSVAEALEQIDVIMNKA